MTSPRVIVQPTLMTLSCTLLLIFLSTWQVSSTNPAAIASGMQMGSGSGSGSVSGTGSVGGATEEEYNDNNSNRVEELVDYDNDDIMAKRHMGSIAAYSGVRSQAPFGAKLSGGYYGDNGLKLKRFLGTLARGGWFPRQFRGFVYPSPMGSGFQQKRHIGSVARLGWLPLRGDEMQF